MKTSKISKIKKEENKDIYHLTVEKNHNFFGNGIILHNCQYTGELKVVLINHGQSYYEIKKGDRIAQLVVCPVLFCQTCVTDFSRFDTERGDSGFGSSGK